MGVAEGTDAMVKGEVFLGGLEDGGAILGRENGFLRWKGCEQEKVRVWR